MNIQQIDIEELEIHLSQLKEILQSIIHTIMYSRAFGLVKPIEVPIDFLELYYVKSEDKAMDLKVDEKIEEFSASLSKRKTNKGQIVLSFNERRPKSNFFSSSSVVCWEQWRINISLTDSASKTTNLAYELRKRLLFVYKIVNENRSHIPPITTKEFTPFPFEITIPSASEGGVVEMFWGLLKSPPPLLT